MSSVLHPVGPEPEQTYWVRRALVLGSFLLLMVAVIALVINGTSTGSAVSAAPPPVVAAPADTSSPTPTASASSSASASPSASPSASAEPSEKASSKAKPDATPSKEPTSKSSSKESTKSKSTVKAAPTACAPAKLRTTLTGKQRLKVKHAAVFRLSLINGTGSTCVVAVKPTTFTLTITSGRDRIWSSSDCTTAVKATSKKVAAESELEWTMRWNGRRSADDCKNRPEIPRAGTYLATAKLDGAKPVQFRMFLKS